MFFFGFCYLGCTPALRRRRQQEKYVTDQSQLNLRFSRPSRRTRPISDVVNPTARPQQKVWSTEQTHVDLRSTPPKELRGIFTRLLLSPGNGDESSEADSDPCGGVIKPHPPMEPPVKSPENRARCRRFHPMADT